MPCVRLETQKSYTDEAQTSLSHKPFLSPQIILWTVFFLFFEQIELNGLFGGFWIELSV